MRGWIRGNWRHLMVGLLCTAIVISSCALSDLSPARGVFPLWEWKAGALSGAGDPQSHNRSEQ